MESKGEVRLHWDVKIVMRDGVRLAATVYLPASQAQAAPAIFILTPYTAQSFHDRGVYFAERGYPFVAVDVRGRGNSEGQFSCWGKLAEDGYDIVEWLAKQPYCDGNVAMWGGSYQGYAQWRAASARPPHLRCIVPVASPFPGIDSPMRNNIFVPYMVQWLTMIAGYTLQDRIFADQKFWTRQFRDSFEAGMPFVKLDEALGYPSPFFQEWLAHPQLDAYWDGHNLSAKDYASIDIPVLTITGIYDGDQPGALMHYRQHLECNPDACHYLVIGPWNHAGTRDPQTDFYGIKVGAESLVDLPNLHAEWYAWTMQQGPKPTFLRKKVAYYVMGADRWRYADSLEEVTSHWQPLYLSSSDTPTDVFQSGTLTTARASRSGPDEYRYDPRDVSMSQLQSEVGPWARADQRLVNASAGKVLVYHSAPLDRAVEVTGFFKLSLWLSIDQPDTDIEAAIYEVALDGSVIQLTNDLMRCRYRESLRQEKLVRTTEPLRYDFERFMFTSRMLQPGSRLRLVIGPINSMFSQKNYNSGKPVARESRADARTVTVKLFHDEQHPSALYVPFGQPDDSTRSDARHPGWYAGVAQTDITPTAPLVLGGYGVTFPFSKIDARLRAKALALKWSDEEPVLIVSVDTLKFRETSIGPVRRRVSRQLGLDESRFIFVATHTHEAPMLPGHFGHSDPFLESFLDADSIRKRDSYLTTLQDSLVELCSQAFAAMAPVTLEVGRGYADFAVNRRVRLPDGSVGIGVNRSARVDHEVPSLIVKDRDGRVLGLVFGYACHGTTVQPQIVSPDYMGYAELELQRRFDGAIALFLPGFGGDVNPSPWSKDVAPYPASDGGVANARSHGLKLADAVTSVVRAGGEAVVGPLLLRTSTVELALTPPPTRSELLKELDSAAHDTMFGPRRIARAKAYLDMYSRGQRLPTSVSLPLSYLDLGAHALLFMAGEVVSDYAFNLKSLIQKPLWTVGYAMDCPAYIPSARLIEEGGYEPQASMVNNGWFGPFEVSVEQAIIEGVLELVRGSSNAKSQAAKSL